MLSSKSFIEKYLRRAGYTYMNIFDKPMASLPTLSPGPLPWVAILINLVTELQGIYVWKLEPAFLHNILSQSRSVYV